MAVVLLLAALLAYMYWPTGPVKIIISRETTYIDGPLNPDGTVNYVAYLDANYAEGVTPENNAAPLLLRAFGPNALPNATRNETLRHLNLPADLFDQDKHFVHWVDRARPGKFPATTPALSDEKDEQDNTNQGDEADSGTSIEHVYDMLLAGEVHPDLEAWLAENAGPLELVRQATEKERFYLPLISRHTPPRWGDVVAPPLGYRLPVTKALLARAALKMTRNEPRGAWHDVLAAHRLARLMHQAPVLIEQVIALIIEEQAAKTGMALATRGCLPLGETRELLSKLSALEPLSHTADAFDTERFHALDVVMMMARPGKLRPHYEAMTGLPLIGEASLDWNQMLRDLNAHYDEMIKPLRLLPAKGRQKAQKARDKELRTLEYELRVHPPDGLRMFLLSHGGRPFRGAFTDAMTNVLAACMVPRLSDACDLEDVAGMTREIETLAVALAYFHAENGHWPAELKELCPSLLKAIPADRFSIKPLIYKPSENGYLLYSIGMNMRDDGGQMDPHSSGDEKTDDIAAEVKPADAKPAAAASQPATSQP